MLLENVASSLDGQYDHLVEHLDFMSSCALEATASAVGGGAQLLLHTDGNRAGLLDKVEQSFGAAESIAELHALLRSDGSKWASACLEGLSARPPWATALTFSLLRQAAKLSLEGCIDLEHATAVNIWTQRRAGKELLESDVQTLLSQPLASGFEPALPIGFYREQRHPFSDHAIEHLDSVWEQLQAKLEANPNDEAAVTKQDNLCTFRGALDEVSWLTVQSTLVRSIFSFGPRLMNLCSRCVTCQTVYICLFAVLQLRRLETWLDQLAAGDIDTGPLGASNALFRSLGPCGSYARHCKCKSAVCAHTCTALGR